MWIQEGSRVTHRADRALKGYTSGWCPSQMAVESVMKQGYNNVSERRQAVAAFYSAYMGFRRKEVQVRAKVHPKRKPNSPSL